MAEKCKENKMRGVASRNKELHEETKKRIRESFIFLLKKKSFDSISITELCRNANVSRAGFYANYKNKQDVFKEISETIIQGINDKVGVMQNNFNTKEYYENLFAYVEQNRALYKAVIGGNFEGRYLEAVNEIVIRHSGISKEEQVQRILWAGAMVNITVWWISNGKRISAKEMALWCYNFMEDSAMQKAMANMATQRTGA